MVKTKARKSTSRHKKYQEVIQSRIVNKTPVQYTRRLKTKKHKKLKEIFSNIPNLKIYNRPPPTNEDDYVPASFKQMLLMKEGKWKPLLDPAVGDTKGKYESDAHFLGRVHREVEDELHKVEFSKKQRTELITTEVKKSRKKRKAVKRLNEKQKVKRLYAIEKRLTGFEHLKDEVKFNEVFRQAVSNMMSDICFPCLFQENTDPLNYAL
ncbi:unnamed protein product [Heterobilharzia americana]|nr:unnamed protein product [Heterobilharzia americana]